MTVDSSCEKFCIGHVTGCGQGCIALSPIDAGTEIISATPEVSVLYDHYLSSHCTNCYQEKDKANNLVTCSTCNSFSYCTDCSQDPLVTLIHPLECKWFCSIEASNRKEDTDYLRFLVRYFAHKKLKQEVIQSFDSLCTNTSLRSTEFAHWSNAMAELYLSHFGEVELGTTKQELVDLFAKIRFNSFGFPFNKERTLGWCLQSTLSYVNHSCEPNCFIQQVNLGSAFLSLPASLSTMMELKALRAIDAGEELTISYLDLEAPSNRHIQNRASILFDRYRFECHCTRCIKEAEQALPKT